MRVRRHPTCFVLTTVASGSRTAARPPTTSAPKKHNPPNARRHEAHVWFAPTFGAHILGQARPERVTPARARRAYSQPEARTPLRPSFVKRI